MESMLHDHMSAYVHERITCSQGSEWKDNGQSHRTRPAVSRGSWRLLQRVAAVEGRWSRRRARAPRHRSGTRAQSQVRAHSACTQTYRYHPNRQMENVRNTTRREQTERLGEDRLPSTRAPAQATSTVALALARLSTTSTTPCSCHTNHNTTSTLTLQSLPWRVRAGPRRFLVPSELQTHIAFCNGC